MDLAQAPAECPVARANQDFPGTQASALRSVSAQADATTAKARLGKRGIGLTATTALGRQVGRAGTLKVAGSKVRARLDRPALANSEKTAQDRVATDRTEEDRGMAALDRPVLASSVKTVLDRLGMDRTEEGRGMAALVRTGLVSSERTALDRPDMGKTEGGRGTAALLRPVLGCIAKTGRDRRTAQATTAALVLAPTGPRDQTAAGVPVLRPARSHPVAA